MSQRLTDRLGRTIEAPVAGNRIVYDFEVKGFGVRITKAGARAWVINYRANGRQRRATIGDVADWPVQLAREQAKSMKRLVDQGCDPVTERAVARQAPTVADLVDRYEADVLPKKAPRSHGEDRALGRRLVARLGQLKVAAVRHADLDQLHREISRAGTPIRANRVISLASRLFNLAIKWGWRADNPCRGIERNPERPRARYLTPSELVRLAAALDAHPEQPSADVVRLLLLTGARRGEVLRATWDMFDLVAGVWTKPSAATKQRREHRIPLSAAAMQILARRREAAGDSPFLFPGASPDRPQGDLKRFWRTVCRQAQIEGARVHDWRHSHASILASAGLSLPVIGALLGHTAPDDYDPLRHLLDDPLRQASERVAEVLAGGQSAEIVPLPDERQRG